MTFFLIYAFISGWKNINFITVQNPPNLPRHETPTTFNPLEPCNSCNHSMTDHVKHLQGQGLPVTELNRLLSIVMDVEYLSIHFHREEDPDGKQVYFYLFKVHIHILNTITKLKHCRKNCVSYDTTTHSFGIHYRHKFGVICFILWLLCHKT